MIRALDSKDRISLAHIVNKARAYRITEYPGGTLVLHPVVILHPVAVTTVEEEPSTER